jgi:hypothetical protein
MNLRKLPPSMLLALGLACTTEEPGTTSSCLSTDSGVGSSGTTFGPGSNGATSTSGPSTSTTEISASACLDVGPCLFDIGTPPDMGGWSTGPCLEPPADTGFESSTDGGTETGSGTETEGGTEGGTTLGPCLAPPGVQPDDSPAPHTSTSVTGITPGVDSRRAALERVLERGTLPPDVAARLRGSSR